MNTGKFEFGWDSRMDPVMPIQYKNKKFGLAICHRSEDCCIKLFGHTSFLCARCTGILMGFALVLLFQYLSLPSITVPWVVSAGLMMAAIIIGMKKRL